MATATALPHAVSRYVAVASALALTTLVGCGSGRSAAAAGASTASTSATAAAAGLAINKSTATSVVIDVGYVAPLVVDSARGNCVPRQRVAVHVSSQSTDTATCTVRDSSAALAATVSEARVAPGKQRDIKQWLWLATAYGFLALLALLAWQLDKVR